MTTENQLLQKCLVLQKALFSSLRLKEVLEAAVKQFAELSGGAKIAIFLSDNENMSFKLMSEKGYSPKTLVKMREVPFAAESLLKSVVQKRKPASHKSLAEAVGISADIMKGEGSKAQMALPLISHNLLVGAVLMDLSKPEVISYADFYNEVAGITSLAIANSILFGRSEYERERVSTLYKTACSLTSSMLQINEVLQIASDTAIVLGNTPCCAVLLIDESHKKFRLAAFKGLEGTSLNEYDLTVSDSIAGNVLKSGKVEYFGDEQRRPYGMPKATGGSEFRSVLSLPILADSGTKGKKNGIGVLQVFSTEFKAFNKEQIELLESLCSQVAASLSVALTHQTAAAQASYDANTGLYNRLYFDDVLPKEVERAQRHKHQLGLLLIDIDHLGQINDHLGQKKGDEAIAYVAAKVKKTLRDIDIACRYGGEELIVILPETPEQNLFMVAERLRKSIRNDTAPGVGTVTVSVGVSSYPNLASSPQELVTTAEQAVNIAKYEGRDKCVLVSLPDAMQPGDISWGDLAKQAKLAVVAERQSMLHSRLDVNAEYASWLHAPPQLVSKKKK